MDDVIFIQKECSQDTAVVKIVLICLIYIFSEWSSRWPFLSTSLAFVCGHANRDCNIGLDLFCDLFFEDRIIDKLVSS